MNATKRINSTCPACHKGFSFLAFAGGQQVPCPHCGAAVSLKKPWPMAGKLVLGLGLAFGLAVMATEWHAASKREAARVEAEQAEAKRKVEQAENDRNRQVWFLGDMQRQQLEEMKRANAAAERLATQQRNDSQEAEWNRQMERSSSAFSAMRAEHQRQSERHAAESAAFLSEIRRQSERRTAESSALIAEQQRQFERSEANRMAEQALFELQQFRYRQEQEDIRRRSRFP